MSAKTQCPNVDAAGGMVQKDHSRLFEVGFPRVDLDRCVFNQAMRVSCSNILAFQSSTHTDPLDARASIAGNLLDATLVGG